MTVEWVRKIENIDNMQEWAINFSLAFFSAKEFFYLLVSFIMVLKLCYH